LLYTAARARATATATTAAETPGSVTEDTQGPRYFELQGAGTALSQGDSDPAGGFAMRSGTLGGPQGQGVLKFAKGGVQGEEVITLPSGVIVLQTGNGQF
jgi:hypothetical protein